MPSKNTFLSSTLSGPLSFALLVSRTTSTWGAGRAVLLLSLWNFRMGSIMWSTFGTNMNTKSTSTKTYSLERLLLFWRGPILLLAMLMPRKSSWRPSISTKEGIFTSSTSSKTTFWPLTPFFMSSKSKGIEQNTMTGLNLSRCQLFSFFRVLQCA